MKAATDSRAPTIMPVPERMSSREFVQLIDPWIVGSIALLLGLGAVLVYSASSVRAFSEHGDGEKLLVAHLSSIALGLVLLSVSLRIPSEVWGRLAYLLLFLTVVALIALHFPPLGRRANGALRWLVLGPLSFQPAELAKLSLVIYLAHSLAKKRERISSFAAGFIPHVVVTSVVVALIIVQPDLGTSALILAILGLMLFVAGTRISFLVLAAVAMLPVGYHYVNTHPHAAARLLVFMNPEAYKQDIGYQVWESLVAFGSGGLGGLGLGAGQHKLYYLPEAHTDFVFSVLGQELGLLGVVVVVLAFAVIVGRGLLLARRMTCRFPMFLAFGLTSWIGIQAFTNMAVATALLPTKGMTLPLVSFGRTSVVVTLLALGILLRLGAEWRAAQRKGGLV